jgi:hypothetical protein
MQRWFVGMLAVLGWLILTRSGVGIRIGNQVRAWSDRAMLTFLRLTSEFERERQGG